MHYKIQAEMDSVLATLKTTTDDEDGRCCSVYGSCYYGPII